MKNTNVIDLMIFEQLRQFRQGLYERLGNAKDAVFELMDAVLTSASTVSFVSLSQSPVFRRQWPSVYAALHDSRMPSAQLMQELAERVDTVEQPILAGDRTFWVRRDAVLLRTLGVGHYRCVMSASAALRPPANGPPFNYSR